MSFSSTQYCNSGRGGGRGKREEKKKGGRRTVPFALLLAAVGEGEKGGSKEGGKKGKREKEKTPHALLASFTLISKIGLS